jgi:predicted metalloprotease
MSFNENVQIDTSQVESGGSGGGPGGLVVGGGIGGLILVVIMMFLGINPNQLPSDQGSPSGSGQVQPGGSQSQNDFASCKTGADANKNDTCRVIATVNSVQAFWAEDLARYGKEYTPAKTVLYSGATQSRCGTASNQVGPFYCPLDKKVYIDASFFQILTDRFGSDDGALAQEYVVAHEYGHHIQDELGLLGRAQQDPNGAQSGAVRIELMADCLAGVWAKHATETKDAQGVTFLKPLTQKDIDSALSAASAVGDDRIQKQTQGQVNPETWTHGSSEARQRWFMQGYTKGDLNSCDTFSVDQVE